VIKPNLYSKKLRFLLVLIPFVLLTTVAVSYTHTKQNNLKNIDTVCISDTQEIVESSIDDWVIDKNSESAVTKDNIKLGVKYVFPTNNKLTVTFKCLPKEGRYRSSLKIKQISAQRIALPNDLSPQGMYAYDLTSNMVNGSFKYDVTMPTFQGSEPKVLYFENPKDITIIESDMIALGPGDGLLTISGVNHFSIITLYAESRYYSHETDTFPVYAPAVYMRATSLEWPYQYRIMVKDSTGAIVASSAYSTVLRGIT
jgi:hypothetical protein